MRYLCIHGHFYQPPRENPSLEAIELQDSAYPYHDWNDRVTAECYAPNATSRILDAEQRIVELVNNYSRISFNFGPTLLSWIEQKAPKVYEALREADKSSGERYSGHGSAIAQAYNHMIMPLANSRDKNTQVKWGLRDFEYRFGRLPEGIWLPETAADTETLDVLAANGIKFTILAPRQAKRIRKRGSRSWQDVSGDRIDPSRAYLVKLPSKRTISVFFYDGPISQGVAFERLLDNGQRFADRLLSGFSDARQWPQLVHIATDGESYGHHHRFGEMALSYALHHIETNKLAQLTNYGEFLEKHPPDHFVEIVNNSSWSCVHGLERWRSNCGCNTGGHAGWNQEWRAPLRAALDWLRDELAPLYEQKAAPLLKDPWAARDEYIQVVLNRAEESIQNFFGMHATHPLPSEEQVAALKLLEMQRHAMLMYTSCGWFFDELSGLETVQVIQYAGRAVRLAQNLGANGTESGFMDRLAAAKSNIPENRDGQRIYEKWVKPAFVSIDQLAGHYAISSLFEPYGERTRIYCYDVQREDYALEVEGKHRMAVGHATFSSEITRELSELGFAVLHLGDHNIAGGVGHFDRAEDYDQLKSTLVDSFGKADTTQALQIISEKFPNNTFSLRTLFRDEQRKIVDLILKDSLATAEAAYRSVYENQAPLIRFLTGLGVPIPPAFQSAAQIAVNSQLKQSFEQRDPDFDTIQSYLKEAAASNIALDVPGLEYAIRKRLEAEADIFASAPANIDKVQKLNTLLKFVSALPFPVTLWEVQNICYRPLIKTMDEARGQAQTESGVVSSLLDALASLRENLRINGKENSAAQKQRDANQPQDNQSMTSVA
jgi:alpha-amylase/alpha-mannosidase (GH57 family)